MIQAVQNYLNDQSIPLEKRQKALSDLNSGIPDTKVYSAIKMKYGERYDSGAKTVSEALPDTGSSQITGDIKGKLDITDIKQGLSGVKESFANLGGRIKEATTEKIETGGKVIEEGVEKIKGGEPIEGITKIVTGGAKAGIAPLSGIIEGVAEPGIETGVQNFQTLLEEGLKKRLGYEQGAIAYDKLKTNASEDLSEMAQAYEALPSNLKTAVDLGGAAVELFTTLEGGRIIEKPLKELAETGTQQAKKILQVSEDALRAARLRSENASINRLETAINESIEKGIKPSMTGSKKTIQGMDKWKNQARQAIDTIIDNKDNLNLVDEFGEQVVGSPQTLRQFSDAIDQTKKDVFNQYDALARQASGEGIVLEMKNTANELQKIIDNKVLQTEKPEIVDYAMKKLDRYADVVYSPDEAQEAIKILNQSLDAFYKQPSYDTASKAYVDALVVNNLRKNLDDLIGQATGEEYQALKNQYAALKAIEKDVVHRTLVDARKNSKGLIDFTDIFSGGEAVAGILSLNPALLAKSATQKGIKEWYKYMNDPNVIIKNMFQKAETVKNIKNPNQ